MSRLEKFVICAYWALVVVGLVVILVVIVKPAALVHKVNNGQTKCCSANECEIQHHHDKIAANSLTNEQLQLWYETLNEDYYLGQLPKETEVRWSDLTQRHYMGITERRPDKTFTIFVDRTTNPTWSETELTVAHETCHIKTWDVDEPSHGPKFQTCMVNLAVHGAFEGIW